MHKSGFSYGIDLGGTSTRVGLFDGTMQLLGSRSIQTLVNDGPSAAVKAMAQAIAAIASETHCESTLGIGIGSPGPIDLREGILGKLPNLPGWDGFPLRHALSEATGNNVILESDANAAALAEWQMGAGSTLGLDSMAMLTLGTGVGSGLILNGRIWHGTSGMAGEVGHATIHPDGELCSCGSRGCLELYTSAGAVVRAAIRYAAVETMQPEFADAIASDEFSAKRVAEFGNTGNPVALRIYSEFGHSLGIGLANLVNTLDVPLIVVGGGVAEAWNLFCPAMLQSLEKYSVVYRLLMPKSAMTYQKDRTHICPAALGPAAGLIGAGLLPRLVRSRSDSVSEWRFPKTAAG